MNSGQKRGRIFRVSGRYAPPLLQVKEGILHQTTGQMIKFLPDFIGNSMPTVRWYCHIHLVIGDI
jgi:hypothetical protein